MTLLTFALCDSSDCYSHKLAKHVQLQTLWPTLASYNKLAFSLTRLILLRWTQTCPLALFIVIYFQQKVMVHSLELHQKLDPFYFSFIFYLTSSDLLCSLLSSQMWLTLRYISENQSRTGTKCQDHDPAALMRTFTLTATKTGKYVNILSIL